MSVLKVWQKINFYLKVWIGDEHFLNTTLHSNFIRLYMYVRIISKYFFTSKIAVLEKFAINVNRKYDFFSARAQILCLFNKYCFTLILNVVQIYTLIFYFNSVFKKSIFKRWQLLKILIYKEGWLKLCSKRINVFILWQLICISPRIRDLVK